MLKQPRTRSVSSVSAPLPRQPNPFARFQICNPGDVWLSVDPATANRIARKATGAAAALVRAKRKSEERRAEAQADRRAALSVLTEQREADRRYRVLWRRIRMPVEARPSAYSQPTAKTPSRSMALAGFLQGVNLLPRYSGAIIDRAGRTGIFFRSSYYGKATKSGVGRRATKYIFDGALAAEDGRAFFESNVGETPEEAMAALEFVELVNREAQSNGKALFHIIANVPYQLERLEDGADRMFEIARRFAEHQYGSRNLPYAIALHPPSEEGDERNWHIHVLASTRPLVRTGAYAWDVGEMLRREIDNPAAFATMRQLYAQVQTEVAQEAGLNITYTALSNAARGLPNAPQQHLGGKRTAKVRAGERDPVNERNHEIQMAGEAALIDEKLRHVEQVTEAERNLINRVEARFAKAVPTTSELAVPAVSQPIISVPTLPRVPRLSTIGRPAVALTQVELCSVSILKGDREPLLSPPAPSSIPAEVVGNLVPSLSTTLLGGKARTIGAGPPLSQPTPRSGEAAATVSISVPSHSTNAIAAPATLSMQMPGIDVPGSVAISRAASTVVIAANHRPAVRFEAQSIANSISFGFGVEKRDVPARLVAAPATLSAPVDQRYMDQLQQMARLAVERDRALIEKHKKQERAKQLARAAVEQPVSLIPSVTPAAQIRDPLLVHAAERRGKWMSGWKASRRLDAPAQQDGAAPSLAEGSKVDGQRSARPRPFPGRDVPSR